MTVSSLKNTHTYSVAHVDIISTSDIYNYLICVCDLCGL